MSISNLFIKRFVRFVVVIAVVTLGGAMLWATPSIAQEITLSNHHIVVLVDHSNSIALTADEVNVRFRMTSFILRYLKVFAPNTSIGVLAYNKEVRTIGGLQNAGGWNDQDIDEWQNNNPCLRRQGEASPCYGTRFDEALSVAQNALSPCLADPDNRCQILVFTDGELGEGSIINEQGTPQPLGGELGSPNRGEIQNALKNLHPNLKLNFVFFRYIEQGDPTGEVDFLQVDDMLPPAIAESAIILPPTKDLPSSDPTIIYTRLFEQLDLNFAVGESLVNNIQKPTAEELISRTPLVEVYRYCFVSDSPITVQFTAPNEEPYTQDMPPDLECYTGQATDRVAGGEWRGAFPTQATLTRKGTSVFAHPFVFSSSALTTGELRVSLRDVTTFPSGQPTTFTLILQTPNGRELLAKDDINLTVSVNEDSVCPDYSVTEIGLRSLPAPAGNSQSYSEWGGRVCLVAEPGMVSSTISATVRINATFLPPEGYQIKPLPLVVSADPETATRSRLRAENITVDPALRITATLEIISEPINTEIEATTQSLTATIPATVSVSIGNGNLVPMILEPVLDRETQLVRYWQTKYRLPRQQLQGATTLRLEFQAGNFRALDPYTEAIPRLRTMRKIPTPELSEEARIGIGLVASSVLVGIGLVLWLVWRRIHANAPIRDQQEVQTIIQNNNASVRWNPKTPESD